MSMTALLMISKQESKCFIILLCANCTVHMDDGVWYSKICLPQRKFYVRNFEKS